MNLNNYPTDALINDVDYVELIIMHCCQAIESDNYQSSMGISRDEVSHLDAVILRIAQVGEQFKADKMSHYFNDFFDAIHDWHGLANVRQRVIHGYETVDEEIVWEILDKHIPLAIEAAEYALSEMRRELSRRDV